MKGYKLTRQDLTTYGGFQWEVGKVVTVSGHGGLCTSGWLHFYDDPLLAVLLNPIHAAIAEPRLWEFKADGKIAADHGLKFGCSQGWIVRELPLPVISAEAVVAFGILCAKQVCKDAAWNKWADSWLDGTNRSRSAARSAAWSAAASAAESARSAAWSAARSAAASAAESAAWSAMARSAAESAAWSAMARSAAWSAMARSAAESAVLNLKALAKQATKMFPVK